VFDNFGGVYLRVSVCVCEERGRCVTTLDGCVCMYVCVCEEGGRCLTTLVECVWVHVYM